MERRGPLSKSNRDSSGWVEEDRTCLEFQAMATGMAWCRGCLICRFKVSQVLHSQPWSSQLCLMLRGREQLRERAKSSWVRAELKEQPPQF